MLNKNKNQEDINARIEELKAVQEYLANIENEYNAPFKRVYFEISGTCNAICPWCERGARARKLLPPLPPSQSPTFISLDTFTHRLQDLLQRKIIDSDASIHLYNWGEPLLHPHFNEIVTITKELGLSCGISTNGSHVFDNPPDLSHLSHLCLSMPGFSQASYDHAHGFPFENTIKNIKTLILTAKAAGCPPSAIYIYGHIYRHNQHEVPLLKKFAKELGVTLQLCAANFNAFTFFTEYLQGKLPPKTLAKAKQDLFLFDPEKLKGLRPIDYQCPQFNYLTLSHTGKMSTCCGTQLGIKEEYEFLDFDEYPNLSLKDIYKMRKNSPACVHCQNNSLDWLVNNYDKVIDSSLASE